MLARDERCGLMLAPDERYGLILAPDERYGLILAPDERYGLILAPDERYGLMLAPDERYGLMYLFGCLIFSYEVGIIHIQLTGFIHKCLPKQGPTIPEHSVVIISVLNILMFDRGEVCIFVLCLIILSIAAVTYSYYSNVAALSR